MNQIPIYTSFSNKQKGKKPMYHTRKKVLWAFLSIEDAKMLQQIHNLIENDKRAIVRLNKEGKAIVQEADIKKKP